MKKYIEKYQEIKDRHTDETQFNIFRRLINSMIKDDEALFEFTEDMLTVHEDIDELFEPSGRFTLKELAFDLLVDILPIMVLEIKPILQKLYTNALDGLYESKTNQYVVRQIQAIAAVNKDILDIEFIIEKILGEYKISEKDELKLLILMSQIKNEVSTVNWLIENVQDKNRYALFPALIVAFDEIENPLRGLNLVLRIPIRYKPDSYTYTFFETAITDAIIRSVKLGKDSKEELKIDFSQIKHPVFNQIFNQVFSSREFENIEELIPETIEYMGELAYTDTQISKASYVKVKKRVIPANRTGMFRNISQLVIVTRN